MHEILHARGTAGADALGRPVKELFEQVRSSHDELNQNSFPFGLPELRHAIARSPGSMIAYDVPHTILVALPHGQFIYDCSELHR